MYSYLSNPKKINKQKIENTLFLENFANSDSTYSNNEQYLNSCIDTNIKTNENKEEIYEFVENKDIKMFYDTNYELFNNNKEHYIKLIEKLLNRTDLNLYQVQPDINYIYNKYKTFNISEYQKVKHIALNTDSIDTQLRCHAYTHKGIQCSRQVELIHNEKETECIDKINYCGIHKKKQKNGNINTGFYKK